MKWIFSFYFSSFLNAYNSLYASFFKLREKASVNFLSKNSISLLFSEFLATASIHLVTPTAVLKLTSFHGRVWPEFWHQINTSFHGDFHPKNWNSFSLFPLMKRALLPALGFWPIIWPLSSSSTSPCHAIHSGYYTDLCIPFSVQPTWGYGVQIAWPISNLGSLLHSTGRLRSWPTFLFLF